MTAGAGSSSAPSLVELLGPGGAIARRLGEGYEVRSEQVELAAAVERALVEGRHLLAEAGTGVGKSFAYLLPAIHATARRGKRVVVSTHTIALQEQIIDKDVPLLRAACDDEFTAVLVKGRNNYVCLRRLDAASRRASHLFETKQQRDALADLHAWSDTTTTGDVATLPVLPDMRVWEQARAEAGNCMGKRCAFYKPCHWQAARRRTQTANLLVVNHALFFSDLALRLAGVQYLPKYDHVIFDEAHALEDAAAQHFGLRVSEGSVAYALRHLFDPRRTKGFLTTLPTLPASSGKIDALVSLVAEAGFAAEAFFERCLAWRDEHAAANGRVRIENFVPDDLSPRLADIAKRLTDVAAGFDDKDDAGLERKLETTAQAEKVRLLAATLDAFVKQALPDAVYWVEAAGRTPRRVGLHASPVDVGGGLRLALWSKTPGCALLSATLATSGADPFGHVRRRLGLDHPDAGPVDASAHGSPFDYRTQARLYVETGLPDPSDPHFPAQSAARILHWVRHTRGGAFVLFTSYKALIDAANRLADDLADAGLPLLVQGQNAPRRLLLERFRSEPGSVLFGTSSFWQGVDVRGEALRNVIIHKLPFAVPDDPVQQARVERVEASGGNGFYDYSVPEAVVRLKQGFGRLIRSGTDRGIVVLLDGRILSRRYGRAFLEALPDVPVVAVDHRRSDGDGGSVAL